MPSCFEDVSVRTSAPHQSEYCAPLVQIFEPLTSQWSPLSSHLVVQRGEVGARAGLGVADAPTHFAPHDRRDVARLLLVRAVVEDGRADHGDAHAAAGDGVVGADLGQLLLQDPRLGVAETAAAVLLRPGRRPPALLAHALAPGERIAARLTAFHELAQARAAAQRFREVRLQPGSHFAPKGLQLQLACVVGHRVNPCSTLRFRLQPSAAAAGAPSSHERRRLGGARHPFPPRRKPALIFRTLAGIRRAR